jgi:U5 snRNP protein, DIM1 family
MGSVILPHLRTGWHVDQAIMNEEERLVVIRFGRDYEPDCMRQDEVLYKIADRVKNFAVLYGEQLKLNFLRCRRANLY